MHVLPFRLTLVRRRPPWGPIPRATSSETNALLLGQVGGSPGAEGAADIPEREGT